MQRTLSIIKPDGVSRNVIGEVISRFETRGLKVKALKMIWLTNGQAKEFYKEHRDQPFYEGLTDFMAEGPIAVMVLEGEGAIAGAREAMGATDPAEAAPGTIRADFATDTRRNVVHGSDSPESAEKEIPFFFSATEILG